MKTTRIDVVEELAIKAAYQYQDCFDLILRFGGPALFVWTPCRVLANQLLAGIPAKSQPDFHLLSDGVYRSIGTWLLDEVRIEHGLARRYCRCLIESRPKQALGILLGWARGYVESGGSLETLRTELESLFDALGVERAVRA